jgi:hypothetical protein
VTCAGLESRGRTAAHQADGLFRGSLEGFIMGVAYQRVPDWLHGRVAAELSVENELGEVVGSAQLGI